MTALNGTVKMPASVNSELTRFCYIEYLKTFSSSELAYWLINSFTPDRYRNKDDVIQWACKRMYDLVANDIASEFNDRLWGMHGELPDNVVYL